MKRRSLFKTALLSCLPLAHSNFAKAAQFRGKYLLSLQADGGWDVSAFCDPKVNVPGEKVITHWSDKRKNTLGGTLTCRLLDDATYFDEILDELGLENTDSLITYNEQYQSRQFDWPAAWEVIEPHFQDPNYTKNAWVAVMIYMLSHYDYLYE